MSLMVELSGYGLCRQGTASNITSFSVFVITVQQENYQGWTVYRRYQSFIALAEHLRTSIFANMQMMPLPAVDVNNLQTQYMEQCTIMMNYWLKTVTSNPDSLRTQFMYQFLCVDANMQPPYFDFYLVKCNNNVTETGAVEDEMEEPNIYQDDVEMEMEDMYDQSSPQHGNPNNHQQQGFHNQTQQQQHQHQPQYLYQQQQPQPVQASYNNHRPYSSNNKRGFDQQESIEDKNDGMDIQSLSLVEAEFLYDKAVDGIKSSSETVTQTPKPKRKISLESFHIIKVVGKGSFGKVFLVREKSSNTLYALKVLKKEYIIRKNQVSHTLTERSVLGYIQHPYIVQLNMAFQTQDKLFFVLDYCAGGELFFHLGKVGKFSESRAKFYAAQIILALEYVHGLDIIYRDLKPENVLLDAKGNVKLTDFGLSKEGVSDHSTGAFSFCGTPEYIAPEVLLRQGHGRAVDWWSLGALLYEMISGLPPFYSRNRETMFQKIMKAELSFPNFMSKEASDILSKLLIRDPNVRLGSGEKDAAEVKGHVFFNDLDWDGLLNGRIAAPWAPTVTGSLDTSQFDAEFTSMNPAVSPDVREAYFGSVDRTFEGFSFVDDKTAKMMNQHFAPSSYKPSSGFSMLSSSIHKKY